ncbi:DNA packaging protein [Paenibacillus aceti]|uniref:Terminase n=1 Tax=Paenibacillus aceti TaxID=1820010 RepID=A0ABQ1VP91_9BACL|nr:DNA packaging protein [Paenibacillus aceti]GGF86360.1 terminase [Paenibacillus aceti]
MALKVKPLTSNKKTIKKTKDIKQERFNEIMGNFPLFCTDFVKILDNFGELIPFKFNKEQADFVESMGKFNIILKSRQIGFSTVSLAICLWNAVNRPNSSYMIVSLDRKQVSTLFERLKLMNDNLPRDIYTFPVTVRDNKDELLLSNGSRIQISPPAEHIGRGSTYQYILLSEYAFYEIDQAKLLTSVTQALAKNPDSKIVIESTANGTSNYFYEVFNKSFKGNTNFKAYFYGWISDAHKTQFKTEINDAVGWYKSINRGQLMNKSDLTTDEDKRLHKAGATYAMLCWRQWKLTSMSTVDFQTEYPSTHTEAFKTSGRNVFDQGKIIDRLNNLFPPIDKEILKKGLPQTLHKWLGKGLSVYHLPKHNVKFYGGSDVSSGSGGDSSTLTLMDAEGVEVLSFHNNKISVYEFAEFLNIVGRLYNYAYLAIEKNSYGLPVIQRLREDYQYMNLYKHKTFDNRGKRKLILGWLTTEVTKSIMISDLKENFERGYILINSQETLQQMQLFIEDSKGKTGNKGGRNNHDDLVISHGLCIQAKKANKWYV